METHRALIAGERVETQRTFDDVDPSNGEVIGTIARCGADEVGQAVDAARQAFRGWRSTKPENRSRVLRRIGEKIAAESEELAERESIDTGKPLAQARSDARFTARYFEFYANTLEAMYGSTIASADDSLVYSTPEPFGVTGHIIPWNYPMQITGRTIAPALAMGNCCVLKPAEEAPLTPLRLAEIALEAGLPPGCFNVVPGLGAEAGHALATHPGIDHLAFTGSVPVGAMVAKGAAENVVPVSLELGGKSPNVVLADADVELAVPAIVGSIIQNAGQTCSAGSRLLVEESRLAEVVEAVIDRFESVTLGPGVNDPDLGPLISKRQQSRVSELVEAGKAQARLLTGGGPPLDKELADGFFFSPTVFDRVPEDAAIAQAEIFGPVLSVMSFRDLDEAIRIANGTPFGLLAAIWTQDLDKAMRLAREIQAGQIFVNNYGAGGGVELPFGGFKKSGYGREKGFEALAAYSQTKTVAIKIAAT